MSFKTAYEKFCKKLPVRKAIALLVCVLFICGSLLSAALTIRGAEHDHNISRFIQHEHNNANESSCAACTQSQIAVSLLKFLSAVLISTVFIYGSISVILTAVKTVAVYSKFQNPVLLKVRIDN